MNPDVEAVTQGSLLCIDLAPMEGSVALLGNDGLVREKNIPGSLRHTEQVIPTIDALLKENQTTLESLSGIILNRGPGSFTGLRVAFSTAKALAHSRQLTLHSVCGAEARRLGAARELGLNAPPDVLTCLTQEKFLLHTFPEGDGYLSAAEMKKYVSETKTNLIVDPATAKVLGELTNAHCKVAGSKAHYLGIAFKEGKTRRDYLSSKDIIEAAPEYFGTTRYATVGGGFFEPQTR